MVLPSQHRLIQYLSVVRMFFHTRKHHVNLCNLPDICGEGKDVAIDLELPLKRQVSERGQRWHTVWHTVLHRPTRTLKTMNMLGVRLNVGPTHFACYFWHDAFLAPGLDEEFKKAAMSITSQVERLM